MKTPLGLAKSKIVMLENRILFLSVGNIGTLIILLIVLFGELNHVC